jgi:hypothetical protein
MSKKILGISWLHGRFQAVALDGARVLASWDHPQPVELDADFESALDEAIRRTGYTGKNVVVVLDHRSLLFHVQETPPVRGKVLRQLLERLVAQNRFYEERAAWGHVTLPAAKERHRSLLALLPESLVRHLTDACAGRRLQLQAVVPLGALLSSHLRALSAPPEEVVVLAIDLGGSLLLLLGRGDGRVLFSRSVLLTSSQQAERVTQEVNRTLHYAQQQFGATVNNLFVFGDAAFATLKGATLRSGLTVHRSPVPERPSYFSQLAAAVTAKTPLNLVSPAESQQRRVRQLAAAAIAALLVGSTLTALKVESVVRARDRKAAAIEQRLDGDARAHELAAAQQNEAQRLERFVRLVGTTNEPPVGELFLRFLPTVVPDTLRLTRVNLSRGTNGWDFQLEGFAREQANGYLSLLGRFENSLEEGLFHAQILESTHRQLAEGRAAATGAAPVQSGGRADERPFFVTGIIP